MDELRSVARESAHLMDGGWYTVPFLRAFIDEDDATVFEEADAAYIAAASPDVILGLLDRIAELEKALKGVAFANHASVLSSREYGSAGGPCLCVAHEDARDVLVARSSSKVETP